MTISGIPRSHLTLFRAARERRRGKREKERRERKKDDSLNLVQLYLIFTFLPFDICPIAPARMGKIGISTYLPTEVH